MRRVYGAPLAMAVVVLAGTAGAAELRFGIKQETPTIDPHFSTNYQAVYVGRHAFNHLIEFDDKLSLAPGLAESWRAVDDLTWEFKLRRGVKFHDGSPFTADDVIFSINRAATIEATSSFKQYLAGKVATKVDDFTVRVTTKEPQPLMETDLASFGMVSKKHAEGKTTADFNSGAATIGTGPYKFVEFKTGDRLVYEANKDYWGPKPKWDKVTFKPISSDPTRLAALKAGDIDIMDIVPTQDVGTMKKDPNFVVSEGPGNRPWYLWLDSRRDIAPDVVDNDGKPIRNPLRDWKVRRAIALAVNRQAIVERVFEGSAAPTMQLLPDNFYGFNTDLKVEAADPAQSRKLLTEAGFPNGFRMTLHGGAGSAPNDAKVLEALAQMFTQVGIKTEVKSYPSSVFFDKAGKMEFGIAVRTYSVASGEPSIQLKAIVHTNNWPNTVYCCSPSGYSNPVTDQLIEEAVVTVDKAKREKLFKDAIGIAVRDVGIIGVYFQYNSWASRKGLKFVTRLDQFNLADNVVTQ